MIHTVKGFSTVNEAEVFLELSFLFYDPSDVGNLISGSLAFSKSSLYIWKFSVHILLKPSLEDFEHYLVSMWSECNCVIVWKFFGIAFLWDRNENWPFPVLWNWKSSLAKKRITTKKVNMDNAVGLSWRRWWHPTPVLLPGKSHGQRSLVGCSPWGREESDTTERLHFHFSLSCLEGGNGNPLQCSCLEDPRDGGAWWAAVYGVAQSQTRLKRLSSSSSSSSRASLIHTQSSEPSLFTLSRAPASVKKWFCILCQDPALSFSQDHPSPCDFSLWKPQVGKTWMFEVLFFSSKIRTLW